MSTLHRVWNVVVAVGLAAGIGGFALGNRSQADPLVVFGAHVPGGNVDSNAAQMKILSLTGKGPAQLTPIDTNAANNLLKGLNKKLSGSHEVDLTPNHPTVGIPNMPGHVASIDVSDGNYASLSSGCFQTFDYNTDHNSFVLVYIDVPKAGVPYVVQVDFLPARVPWKLTVNQLSNHQTSSQTLDIAANQSSATFAYIPQSTQLVQFYFQAVGLQGTFFDFKITGF
jgi:hypothetical protein